jgi:hypothetical protein
MFYTRNCRQLRQLAELHTPNITVNYNTQKFFYVFTSRCLVSASNNGRSISSLARNCPRHQLLLLSTVCTQTFSQVTNVTVSHSHCDYVWRFIDTQFVLVKIPWGSRPQICLETEPLWSQSLGNILSEEWTVSSLSERFRTSNVLLEALPCSLYTSPVSVHAVA